MPSDPVIYNPETEPGKMKHTYTGLRPTFPNRGMHYVINDKIVPLRRELMSRPERSSESRWQPDLTTVVQLGLTAILQALREVVQKDNGPLKPLVDRQAEMNAFILSMKDKTTTLESFALAPDATQSDKVLQPSNSRIAVVQFDWTGLNDPDFAQPTPGRIQNSDLREMIIELDGLVVKMSQSPSADFPITINENDLAIFGTHLSNMFKMAQLAASREEPYLPTGVTRSKLDDTFNADAKLDPLLTAGDGGAGDPVTAAKTA